MKNHATSGYSFKQFNDEVNEFHKYLKENKFTDEDIRKILSPLNKGTRKVKILIFTILTSIFLMVLLYLLTHIEVISWHLSALGRIFLIKLLPFWDWTNLKNDKCVLPRFTHSTLPEIIFNCNLCESIDIIDVYDEISEEVLKTRYLDLDTPVIIKGAIDKWPTSVNFIENLLANKEIVHSKPCNLATNVYNGLTTVGNLLLKAHLFDNFFIHFQNCDFNVMKQFRSMTPKPSFIPPELSPVQYNWLLWNRNYNISSFKPIDLIEKFALLRQVTGNTFIKLLPRNNCELECPQINVKLHEGETIIFTSLWNVEYRPYDGENIAVILEMH